MRARSSLAVQIAAATDGTATVLTLGDADAVEQLRAALAVGCTAAVHVLADPQTFGPADVAREIAAVAGDFDLVLLGNDAADSGDFQVGIRLSYVLGRPVVNGVTHVSVDGGAGEQSVTASGAGPDGHETYRVPLPAVVTVLEGGVEPALPDGARPDEGEEDRDRRTPAHRRAARPGPGAAGCSRRPRPSERGHPRQGRRRRTGRRRPARAPGGADPMIIVLVETTPTGEAVEASRETLTFAPVPGRSPVAGVPVDAVVVGEPSADLVTTLAAYGVRTRARADRRGAYGVVRRRGLGCRHARRCRGSLRRGDGGRHAARQRGDGPPRRALARGRDGGQRAVVQRAGAVRGDAPGGGRWCAGGDAALHRPAVFTVAGHAVEAAPAAAPVPPRGVHTPQIAGADLVARVVSSEEPEPDLSGTLKSARVVVGAGRGAGRPTGSPRSSRPRPRRRFPRRLAGGHLPRVATPPRAGRPDR